MDLFETNLETAGYFRFHLAASAVGAKSDMLLEISVDYGVAKDNSCLVANAWAREQNGVTKGFICTVLAPLGDNEEERIFEELNNSDDFNKDLMKFIELLERHRK